MAKARNSASLPASTDPASSALQQFIGSERDATDQRSEEVMKTPTSVLIEVPIAPLPPSEFIVHIEMKLTPLQSTIARRIAAHLDRQQVCLKNGQRITSSSGAIKWLLERISQELV
jgi:hypothetical protein